MNVRAADVDLAMNEDRVYWRAPGRVWHAEQAMGIKPTGGDIEYRWFTSLCGVARGDSRTRRIERADRIPPADHLCGNCLQTFRTRPDNAARCAICDTRSRPLVRFMLYVKVTEHGRPTTRGAGSILMCSQCWKAAKLESTAHSRKWRSAAA